jgi:hypothetical protein
MMQTEFFDFRPIFEEMQDPSLLPSLSLSHAAEKCESNMIQEGKAGFETVDKSHFDEVLVHSFERRSPSWMYDWMLDLEEWEKGGGAKANSPFLGISGHDVVQVVRERLHHLQKRMPCWVYLNAIADRAKKGVFTSSCQNEEWVKGKSTTSLMEPHEIARSCTNKSNETWLSVCEGIERHRLADEVEAYAREQRKRQRTEAIASFVATHVLKLLDILYTDLANAEQFLSQHDLGHRRALDPCRAYFFSLYSAESDGGTSTNALDGFRLVGPLGERPLHICMFRADDWEEVDGEDGYGSGVKQGILDAVKAFIERGRFPQEIVVPYGKDYCAAVGSLLRSRSRCQGPASWKEIPDSMLVTWSSGLGVTSAGTGESRGQAPGPERFAAGPLMFSPPLWRDLVEWSRGPSAQDCCWNLINSAAGPGRRDVEALVTCGLYEGESALLFMIAARNEEMVSWILDRKARCCSLSHCVGAAMPSTGFTARKRCAAPRGPSRH